MIHWIHHRSCWKWMTLLELKIDLERNLVFICEGTCDGNPG
jgi:hypothetical protein